MTGERRASHPVNHLLPWFQGIQMTLTACVELLGSTPLSCIPFLIISSSFHSRSCLQRSQSAIITREPPLLWGHRHSGIISGAPPEKPQAHGTVSHPLALHAPPHHVQLQPSWSCPQRSNVHTHRHSSSLIITQEQSSHTRQASSRGLQGPKWGKDTLSGSSGNREGAWGFPLHTPS